MFFIGQLNTTLYPSQIYQTIAKIAAGIFTKPSDLNPLAWNIDACRFVNTVPPGWELYDTAAGAAIAGSVPYVIRAPWSDNPNKFKNLRIAVSSSSPYYTQFTALETWDAASHTGSVPLGHSGATTGTNVASQQLTVGINGWILISASANHLLIMGWNSETMATQPNIHFLSEYTRDDPWNTVENGFPAWFMSHTNQSTAAANTSQNLLLPRFMDLSANPPVEVAPVATAGFPGAGAVRVNTTTLFRIAPTINQKRSGTGAAYETYTGLEGIGEFYPNALGINRNKQLAVMLSPLRLIPGDVFTYGFHSGGSITDKTPFAYATRSQWPTGDEIIVDNERYFLATTMPGSANSNGTIAIREA